MYRSRVKLPSWQQPNSIKFSSNNRSSNGGSMCYDNISGSGNSNNSKNQETVVVRQNTLVYTV